MRMLLAIEWRKLATYKTWWVFLILYFSLILGSVYWVYSISFEQSENYVSEVIHLSSFPIYAFPDVWHSITYIASVFIIIPAIFTIIFVCNEFEYGMIGQQVVSGLSRIQLISGKLLFILTSGLFSSVFIFLLCLLVGRGSGPIFEGSAFVFAHFVQFCFLLLLAMMLALVIRRTGLTIIFILVYTFVIFPLLYTKVPAGIRDWIPISSASNLIDFPFMKYFGGAVSEQIGTRHLLITLCYSLLFFIAMVWVMKKRDL